MGFINIRCKNCGSSIKANTESPTVTCDNCGSSFRFDELFNNTISNFGNQNNIAQTNESVFNNQNQMNNNVMDSFNQFNNLPNTNPVNNVNNGIFNQNNMIEPGPINNTNYNSNVINNSPPIIENNNMNNGIPNNDLIMPVQNNNTNMNQNNNTNLKINKKKKKNTKKIFLYVFFSLLMVGSVGLWIWDSQRKPDEPHNELFDPLPSEIMTDDKDKIEYEVESNILKLAPDINIPYERDYYKNQDIIGRLEIPNLLNVLVVKGTDNSFYLSHSIKKEHDIRGTEFIDYRNTPTDKQVNVYGHNTRDVKIQVSFLKLEKFIDKSFFDQNPYIAFQYENGKKLYKIIALKEIYSNNPEHMIIDKTGQEFLDHLRNMTTGEGVINSRDVYYDENSEIIVLQTCSHHWDDAFYTLIAVKIQDIY